MAASFPRTWRAALATTFTLTLAGPLAAEGPVCGDREIRLASGCASFKAAAEGLRTLVRDEVAAKGLNAAILRVSYGGAPLITEAWGQSIAGIPATPDMHFRNGAVAIAYMTIVLLQLQEAGVLSIDDPLSTWFPDNPRAGEITLAMLANNTSGYGDYVDLAVLPLLKDVFRRWTPQELIDVGLAKPMACDPGACFAYAHTNYVILGEVMARASGRSLAELIHEGVLAPLGLRNTRSDTTAAIPSPVMHAYSSERGLVEDSTFWSPSWTLAHGAIMTTDIYDMEVSAVAIGTGSLLSRASYDAMLAPDTVGLGRLNPALYYGLGVGVNNSWVLQTPSFYGFAGAMAYQPANRIAIALATADGPTTPDERVAENLLFSLGAYLAPDLPPRPFGP